MDRNELEEFLQQYEDAHTPGKLMEFLKEELIRKLEEFPADSDRQRHKLNMVIREIEEELDWIENEKLAEYDPEQQ